MIAAILRKGGTLPAEVRKGYDVWPEAVPYWGAFWRLRRRASSGFGPNPVAYSEIVLFADRNGFDADVLEIVVDAMDAVYLKYQAPDDD